MNNNEQDLLPDNLKVVSRQITEIKDNMVHYRVFYKNGSSLDHSNTYENIVVSSISKNYNEDLVQALMAHLGVPNTLSLQESYMAGAAKVDRQILIRLVRRSLDSENYAVVEKCFKHLDLPKDLTFKQKLGLYQLLEMEKV